MKKGLLKIGILLLIFLAAVSGYFIWTRNQNLTESNERIYIPMQESAFPVMYMEMFGEQMNCLQGYSQDMREAVMRDTLTVLPQDRNLAIRLEQYEGTVTGIYYEIRTLDLERLIERTQVESWETTEDGIRAVLPIQNLLTKDQEYLLSLSVTTEENGTIGYYTRIVWTDNQNIKSMIDLARDFTSKTFHYEDASELTMYLEPDAAADNSSLGRVDIHSNFSQITWGGLAMEQRGEIQVFLKELDGIMAQIELKYLAERTTENGVEEIYEVTDDFTLKWNQQRIYMMDFDRRVNQIFTGGRELFSGKRILLGITNDDEVSAEKSPNGNNIAFAVNRDLWLYDQSEQRAVSVFSFRSEENAYRYEFDNHDVKILQVTDEGDVDFLVYGYMNRGVHEGQMGIGVYHYSQKEEALAELFFAPAICSFEELDQDMDRLCYLSGSGMLYLMKENSIYGIDLSSREYVVLADGLEEGTYSISGSGRRLAWQNGRGRNEAESISLMELETGALQTLEAPEGDCIRCLGFVGEDFLYGLAHSGDQWIVNGRLEEVPMYALEIFGSNGELQTRYERDGRYIANVTVDESRIHLSQIVGSSGNSYSIVDNDTIVCNAEVATDALEGIGWYASADRGRLYFVQLTSDVKSSDSIDTAAPRRVSYDDTVILQLTGTNADTGMKFYAYGNGHLTGITQNFAEAVKMAYEDMGVVTDQDQNVLWNRVNRSDAHTIRDAGNAGYRLTSHLEELNESQKFSDGVIGLDGRGLTLNQVLYFIDQGCPVVAFTGEGQYVLLTGFDQFNVTLYNPESGESWKMGLNDASEYFQNLQNDFICGLFAG